MSVPSDYLKMMAQAYMDDISNTSLQSGTEESSVSETECHCAVEAAEKEDQRRNRKRKLLAELKTAENGKSDRPIKPKEKVKKSDPKNELRKLKESVHP